MNTLHHRPLKKIHPFIAKHYRYAVVGASANPEKYGHIVFMDLKNAGYQVTPVHPTLKELDGTIVVPSLRAMHPAPDVAVVVVPPTIGMEVLEDAAAAGVKKVWFQPGAESRELYDRAVELGVEAVTDGSCIMVSRRLFGL